MAHCPPIATPHLLAQLAPGHGAMFASCHRPKWQKQPQTPEVEGRQLKFFPAVSNHSPLGQNPEESAKCLSGTIPWVPSPSEMWTEVSLWSLTMIRGFRNASFWTLSPASFPQCWAGCLYFILLVYLWFGVCFMVVFLVLHLPLGSRLGLQGPPVVLLASALGEI